MSFEDYPVKTKFRDELLDKLAELALRGGKLETEGVQVEVIIEEV